MSTNITNSFSTTLTPIAEVSLDNLVAQYTFGFDPSGFVGIFFAFLCSFLGFAISLVTIYQHLLNYTNPLLQRSVIRILSITPVYSVLSLCSLVFPGGHIFFDAIRDIWEAVVVYCFLSLILDYCGGESACALAIQQSPGSINVPRPFSRCLPSPTSKWFPVLLRSSILLNPAFVKSCKRSTLQFVAIKPFMALVMVFVVGLGYARILETPGWLWPQAIIYNTSYTIALYALALFYAAIKNHADLQESKPLRKFAAVKIIVFATFWQSVLMFCIFQSYVTSLQLMSLNLWVLCIEMPFIAVLHAWAYPVSEFMKSVTIDEKEESRRKVTYREKRSERFYSLNEEEEDNGIQLPKSIDIVNEADQKIVKGFEESKLQVESFSNGSPSFDLSNFNRLGLPDRDITDKSLKTSRVLSKELLVGNELSDSRWESANSSFQVDIESVSPFSGLAGAVTLDKISAQLHPREIGLEDDDEERRDRGLLSTRDENPRNLESNQTGQFGLSHNPLDQTTIGTKSFEKKTSDEFKKDVFHETVPNVEQQMNGNPSFLNTPLRQLQKGIEQVRDPEMRRVALTNVKDVISVTDVVWDAFYHFGRRYANHCILNYDELGTEPHCDERSSSHNNGSSNPSVDTIHRTSSNQQAVQGVTKDTSDPPPPPPPPPPFPLSHLHCPISISTTVVTPETPDVHGVSSTNVYLQRSNLDRNLQPLVHLQHPQAKTPNPKWIGQPSTNHFEGNQESSSGLKAAKI